MGKNTQRQLYHQLIDWLKVERKIDINPIKFFKKKRFKRHNSV